MSQCDGLRLPGEGNSMLEYSLKRTTDPAIEPVTVAEIREHVADADSATDDQLRAWIKTARERVEQDSRRSLITQTWTLKLPHFPTWQEHIELRRPPLIAVTSITYLDEDGNSQTWNAANYEVDGNSEPGIVWLAYDKDWPATRDIQNAVTVVYTAGYGAVRSAVPEVAKQAIRVLVQQYAANRGPNADEQMEYKGLIYQMRPGGYR